MDLVGWAPTRAGQKDTTLSDDPKGKAQGTDRLLIEDYLQRPYQEGGKAEVDYIVARAEREHEYTIDNRGATGWWRDHWGNEARSLLDATLKEVRAKRDTYYALTNNGTNRAAMRSRDAKVLIRDMHFARATIRGDRAGYEKATAELRATFQAIASFVLQAVLTAVLTPAAAALFRGISAAAAATRYGVWLQKHGSQSVEHDRGQQGGVRQRVHPGDAVRRPARRAERCHRLGSGGQAGRPDRRPAAVPPR